MSTYGPERVVGSFAGKPLIVVALSRTTMDRVRELTLAGGAPSWFEYDTSSGIERVSTTDPDWFTELDHRIRAGR